MEGQIDQTEARTLEGEEATGEEEVTKVATETEAATATCASVSAKTATGVPLTEWHPSDKRRGRTS